MSDQASDSPALSVATSDVATSGAATSSVTGDAATSSEDATPRETKAKPWQRLKRWFARPNPVWVREMRQSARLSRTPLILCLVTILTALTISAVGGVSASSSDPATVGTIIFHTFFSVAFAIVSLVGPGVAAMTVASERSGRTWEAMLLTHMTPRQVARGKFAAAFTYIALYVVMLAPVGALSFLFGGISASEVVLAFVFLLLFSVLAVGFGLSLSSAVSNPTVAMLVTVPVAAVLALSVYLGLGVGLSFAVHRFWPAITEGAPVWLPTAYARAEFGFWYIALLLFAPSALFALAAGFFYELTSANIAQPSDDRSSGLRRWFVVAVPLLILVLLLPRALESDRSDMWESYVLAMAGMQTFLGVMLFLFAGEPLTRSRRVESHFQHIKASRLRRFLGPGIEPALLLILLLGSLCHIALAGLGTMQEYWNRAASGTLELTRIVCILTFGGYAVCFLLFLTGFMLFMRARSANGTAPRVLLLLVVFVANAGPWLILAMAGMMGRVDDVLWLASPAPSSVFQLFDSLFAARPNAQTLLFSVIVSATAWALSGVVFWGIGSRSLRQRVAMELTEQRLLDNSTAESTQPQVSV
jgi:hypothetical protein